MLQESPNRESLREIPTWLCVCKHMQKKKTSQMKWKIANDFFFSFLCVRYQSCHFMQETWLLTGWFAARVIFELKASFCQGFPDENRNEVNHATESDFQLSYFAVSDAKKTKMRKSYLATGIRKEVKATSKINPRLSFIYETSCKNLCVKNYQIDDGFTFCAARRDRNA